MFKAHKSHERYNFLLLYQTFCFFHEVRGGGGRKTKNYYNSVKKKKAASFIRKVLTLTRIITIKMYVLLLLFCYRMTCNWILGRVLSLHYTCITSSINISRLSRDLKLHVELCFRYIKWLQRLVNSWFVLNQSVNLTRKYLQRPNCLSKKFIMIIASYKCWNVSLIDEISQAQLASSHFPQVHYRVSQMPPWRDTSSR